MTLSVPTIAIDGDASGAGGSSIVNDAPITIAQSWGQLIANNSDFFQGTGAKIFNMDAGTISTASPAQIGRLVNGVIITAQTVHQNQLLLNAIGAYCRANGISVHVEAQLDKAPGQDWAQQWLQPAVWAGLPITGVEDDDEVAANFSPTDFTAIAQNMVNIVGEITAQYPSVQIGEWQGGNSAATTAAWWAAYDSAATAASLPTISYAVADTSWNAPWVTAPSDWQSWMVALSALAQAKGVYLEVLLDGISTDASGQQWAAQSEQHAAMLAALSAVSVGVILIRTWQTNYPQAALPLNLPTTIGNDAIEIAATYPLYQGGLITAQEAITLCAPAQMLVTTGFQAAFGPISMGWDIADLSAGARVAIVLIDATGLLSATSFSSGTVSGAGSNELILNGTFGEVAAELKSLTVTETVNGPDTIDIELFGANGRLVTSQISVLSLQSPFDFGPYYFASTGQGWTSASAVVGSSGLITSETLAWNAIDQDPATGAYQIIKTDAVYEPLAESGVTIVDGVARESPANGSLPLNASSWNGAAFNPAGHLSSVNVLSTTMTYGSTSGLLETILDSLAATDPTAAITNWPLPNYFDTGGNQVTQFDTSDNPNWEPGWNSWLGSVTSIFAFTGIASSPMVIEQEFEGGASDPYFSLVKVFDPYCGALWEQIITSPPPNPFGSFVTGDEYITEYNTGSNPNWDYEDWGNADKVTEDWQDYYLVSIAIAPPPPTTPQLLSASGSGMSGNVSNVIEPIFTGMAEAGDTVTLYDGTAIIGTGVATGGAWTITTTALADGIHNITAAVTDAAGNVSAASGASSVTIDAPAPIAPSTPDLLAASGNDVSSTDNITNIVRPTFVGIAEAGDTVTLYDGTTIIGTDIATGGSWNITATTVLAYGIHNIRATATDAGGNVSVASQPLSVTIETAIGTPTCAPFVLLQNASGPLALWQMSGPTIAGSGLFALDPGSTWHAKGMGDFYGDGSDTILWQDDDGSVALWDVDGVKVIGGGLVNSCPGATWHADGTGDFYHNGNTAILWQNDDGSVALWEMSGLNIIGGGLVTASDPGPTWHIEGTDDFYGDGNTDILWQNDNGLVALWDMSGTSIIGAGFVNAPNPGPAWHIKGTGDFYGDGHADILWQNDDGAVALWEMNGSNVIGGGLVNEPNPGPAWHIKGTGDFYSNGLADILWQNDDGAVALWEMNGSNVIGGGLVATSGVGWNVVDDHMQFIYSSSAHETLVATVPTPDEFVFTSFAAGSHTISGFNPVQDMIEFSKAQFASFANLQVETSAVSGGAIINLGNGSSLLLAGVDARSLHASNFSLA